MLASPIDEVSKIGTLLPQALTLRSDSVPSQMALDRLRPSPNLHAGAEMCLSARKHRTIRQDNSLPDRTSGEVKLSISSQVLCERNLLLLLKKWR